MKHSKLGKTIIRAFQFGTIIVSIITVFSAQAAMDCNGIEQWDSGTAYTAEKLVQEFNKVYKAMWWSQGNNPASHSGAYQEWSFIDDCTTEAVNQPPSIIISSASGSEQIITGDVVVRITADASDTDGTVTKVEFFVNDNLVGTAVHTPYTLNHTTIQTGNLEIYARATDNSGGSADSAATTLTINSDLPTKKDCRPDGLYQTEDTDVPYCTIYDEQGREIMGADHPRRIIGYFTSWRASDDPQTQYLVKDIPWEQLTHINYAFASIGPDGKVYVGDVNDPSNVATAKEWPGVEIDPALGFKGHFGALATYKKRYDVKTLISIGGWAETGGHFGVNGNRIADGGFYTMTTNDDGSINHTGIEKFATSAVEVVQKYQFDGLDIDYEYPTSMVGAGNPDDRAFMEPRRSYLWASYQELMKVLRQKLDQASDQDGVHYMLTIAAPSSGYLLRGMERYDVTQYVDYVNIMSYDLHGAWNEHVGHHAALYDTGNDSELATWDVYGTANFGGIGYLNTDWAYHYFRGSLPAGRINIGVPYYTRGWQGVAGGESGLWGKAPLPDQSQCAPGTGEGEKNNCGYGAAGIDNLWHDTNAAGDEMGAGSNPTWHALNLSQGIYGSYSVAYGLDSASKSEDKLTGSYIRHYDSVAVAPWLWNAEKKVFLATEDKESITIKADYVKDKEIGGIMFWELAGDYSCYLLDANGNRTTVDTTENACRNGNGEYHMGNTMTKAIYDKFTSATPYGNKVATGAVPSEAIDIAVTIRGFKAGDQNYPINPIITFTNNTGQAIPGGTEFQFDIPTSAPDNAKDQSGRGLKVITSEHTLDNNIGGLHGVMHRMAFTLPGWKNLSAGESYDIDMVYYLPITGPSNYTVSIDGKDYALKFEQPDLPLATIGGGSDNGDECNTTGIAIYPNWPQTDWSGNPSHADKGDKIIHNGILYSANWWTKSTPGSDDSWSKSCTIGSWGSVPYPTPETNR